MSVGRALTGALRGQATRAELARLVGALEPEAIARWHRREAAGAWLAQRLRVAGVHVPCPLAAALRRFEAEASVRRLVAVREAAAAVRVLYQVGIEPVVLKSVAELADPGGARTDWVDPHDVDLLVPEGSLQPAADALVAAGWRAVGWDRWPAGHFHHVPLVRDGGMPIELHVSLHARLAPSSAWDRVRATAGLGMLDGGRVLVPGRDERAWHALAHADQHGADAVAARYVRDLACVTLPRLSPARLDVLLSERRGELVGRPEVPWLLGVAGALEAAEHDATALEGVARLWDWRDHVEQLDRVMGPLRSRLDRVGRDAVVGGEPAAERRVGLRAIAAEATARRLWRRWNAARDAATTEAAIPAPPPRGLALRLSGRSS